MKSPRNAAESPLSLKYNENFYFETECAQHASFCPRGMLKHPVKSEVLWPHCCREEAPAELACVSKYVRWHTKAREARNLG